jgi:hypothetical protein
MFLNLWNLGNKDMKIGGLYGKRKGPRWGAGGTTESNVLRNMIKIHNRCE